MKRGDAQRPATLSVATKTAAALLAIFLVLLGGVWIVSESAVRPGFARLEAQSHDEDKARIEARIAAIGDDLAQRAQDYARWDDSYAFVSGAYRGYPAKNFTTQWFADYDVDLALVSDENGRILWSGVRGRNQRAEPALAAAVLTDARAAAAGMAPVSGVIWSTKGALIYAAAPVTRSGGVGDPNGLVLFARLIESQALSRQVQVDVSILGAARPPATLAEHFETLGAARSQTWSTDKALYSLTALRSASGELVGAVLATRERDITAMGARVMNGALALFAAIAGLAIAALWLVLDRIVIARIVRLQKHLNAQSAAADVALYADTPSRDEIGRLTAAYNALVLRLRESNEQAVRAEFERESADKANDMKSAFLANISHELRTPLNAVIGYAELLDEEMADLGVSGARGDLEKIRAAGKHLLSLVNEILDLSKIEAGKLDIRPSSFRIDEMLRQVADTVAPLAHANDSSFMIETPQDLGAVYSDEMRLRQCLINVSANACKFTQNGTVVLRAERRNEHGQAMLRFEVEDTGIGMTPEQLERVFEPFAQADPLIQRTFGGTGLGLALTRKLLGLLGGRIDAASVRGQGSVFVLTVPVIALEAERPAEAA